MELPVYPLAIRLFGPFNVLVAGAPIHPLRTRKGGWLLALLTLRQDRPTARDWLAGTLWPDSDHSHSLYSLRRCLADLRQSLGPEAYRLRSPTPHSLRLDLGGAFTDVVAFDAAISRGESASLEEAIDLYCGPLLEGCAEEWALPERAAREQNYLMALETLAARSSACGDHAAAQRYLRRIIDLDPLREAAQRALMLSLSETGNTADAVQIYRELRLYLHRELHSEPDSETQALYHQLRSQARPHSAASHPPTATRTSPVPHQRLPRPLTPFIGREEEIQQVSAMLTGSRLVTLTGAGGVGKTRLAIRVAEALSADFQEGAWFVDLSSLTDAELVPDAVASVLEVEETAGSTLIGRLQSALQEKHLLLVLDNCEHLIEACAHLAQDLLAACPNLRILATSRETLRVAGEVAWRVPSLGVPDPTRILALGAEAASALDSYAATRLFVERAAAAISGLALTTAEASAVAGICRRLDGIPLAIELAATRIGVLSVEQIADLLDDRFRLLNTGSRTALPRQQTLQAAIKWSYDLLPEEERALLRRLAVFSGGFTLEAAQAICADLQTGVFEVLDRLAQLVAKSLVNVEVHLGEKWYRLLETTRVYAAEHLIASGEHATVRQRHADYYAALAEQFRERLSGRDQVANLERLRAANDNLRAALDWLLALCPPAIDQALRLSTIVSVDSPPFHLSERQRLLTKTLAACARYPAKEATNKALALTAAAGVTLYRDEINETRTFASEALAIYGEAGDRKGAARALNMLGKAAERVGDWVQARAFNEQILAIGQDLDARGIVALALNNLGVVAYAQRDYTSARAFHTECLAINRLLDHPGGIAWSLDNLADTSLAQGDLVEAQSFYTQSLEYFQQIDNIAGIADCLSGFSRIILARNADPHAAQVAARLLGSVEALRESIRWTLSSILYDDYVRHTAAVQACLGEAQFDALCTEGRALSVEQAIQCALNAMDRV